MKTVFYACYSSSFFSLCVSFFLLFSPSLDLFFLIFLFVIHRQFFLSFINSFFFSDILLIQWVFFYFIFIDHFRFLSRLQFHPSNSSFSFFSFSVKLKITFPLHSLTFSFLYFLLIYSTLFFISFHCNSCESHNRNFPIKEHLHFFFLLQPGADCRRQCDSQLEHEIWISGNMVGRNMGIFGIDNTTFLI